jgi:hypothetical protein
MAALLRGSVCWAAAYEGSGVVESIAIMMMCFAGNGSGVLGGIASTLLVGLCWASDSDDSMM